MVAAFARIVATAGTLVSLAAVLVRVTVRDSSPLFAAVYYATPEIVIAVVLAASALAWRIARSRRLAIGALLAAVALAGLWFARTYYDHPCEPEPEDVRVLLLNTARGRYGWHEVARALSPFDFDIIGLVEAGKKSPTQQQFWQENFPDHTVYLAGGGLALLTRGDLRKVALKPLRGISKYVDAEIDLEGRLLRVILVDLDASPRFDRKHLLSQIFRVADSDPDVPAIVMGDFNTPIDSRWFDRARRRFRHVFEERGSGLLVTWPARLPLVAIDHIWVSREIRVTCAAIESVPISDHRSVTAHLSPPQDGGSATRTEDARGSGE